MNETYAVLYGLAVVFTLIVGVCAIVAIVLALWPDKPDKPELKEVTPYPPREEALRILATTDGRGQEVKTHIVNALYDELDRRA